MNRQSIIVAALVGVLVVAGYYFLLFKPRSDEVAEIEDQIEQVVQQQTALRSRIAALEEVRSQAPEIEARLAAAEAVIPRDPALPSALRQLQLAADDSGLELVSITPGRPDGADVDGAPPELASLSLSLALNGGYFQIVDFLRRVEDPSIVPRGVLWTSVALGVDEYPTLTANLSGEMFALLPTAGGAAPAPSPSPDEGEPPTGGGGS